MRVHVLLETGKYQMKQITNKNKKTLCINTNLKRKLVTLLT